MARYQPKFDHTRVIKYHTLKYVGTNRQIKYAHYIEQSLKRLRCFLLTSGNKTAWLEFRAAPVTLRLRLLTC